VTEARRLVVGVGNADAGDDGAGIAVARALARRNDCAHLVTYVCTGEATSLMEAWTGFDDVVIVDACRGAGAPGSVHSFTPADLERYSAVETRRYGSTHGLGVAAAVGLARALDSLPCRLVIHAIEGRSFEAGSGLSSEVDHAVHEVVALLVQPSQAAGPGTGAAGDK
jgi:hydrogenase maturation protease